MLPMPRLPQRVCGLPATSDSPQPPHCSSPAAGLALTDFLLRTLFLWYPQACLLTSLGSLPKCRFPRDGFPIKKKKAAAAACPLLKTMPPTASKHLLCSVFTTHHSRYVLACKFSVCVSQLEGGVSESWELFHSLLNPQNVDQRPAHSSCAINFC